MATVVNLPRDPRDAALAQMFEKSVEAYEDTQRTKALSAALASSQDHTIGLDGMPVYTENRAQLVAKFLRATDGDAAAASNLMKDVSEQRTKNDTKIRIQNLANTMPTDTGKAAVLAGQGGQAVANKAQRELQASQNLFTTAEREATERFTAIQDELGRQHEKTVQEFNHRFATTERRESQEYKTEYAKMLEGFEKERQVQDQKDAIGRIRVQESVDARAATTLREYQTRENEITRKHGSKEAALTREIRVWEFLTGQDTRKSEGKANRESQEGQTTARIESSEKMNADDNTRAKAIAKITAQGKLDAANAKHLYESEKVSATEQDVYAKAQSYFPELRGMTEKEIKKAAETDQNIREQLMFARTSGKIIANANKLLLLSFGPAGTKVEGDKIEVMMGQLTGAQNATFNLALKGVARLAMTMGGGLEGNEAFIAARAREIAEEKLFGGSLVMELMENDPFFQGMDPEFAIHDHKEKLIQMLNKPNGLFPNNTAAATAVVDSLAKNIWPREVADKIEKESTNPLGQLWDKWTGKNAPDAVGTPGILGTSDDAVRGYLNRSE